MAKIEIDDFLRLVRNRRSIRNFKPDPVPDELINKILEAARWAMSGANGQPWEFIVIKDPETKKKIGDLYAGYWKAIYAIETSRVQDLKHQGFTTLPTGIPGFANAPVIIAVCADPRTLIATVSIAYLCDGEGGPKATFLKNMANATFMLQLATAACGLASQWVSTDRSWMEKLKALLDVPDDLEIHTLVPIGYPAYKRPRPYRRKLKEIVHHEKYDRSKYRTEEDIVAYLRHLRETSRPAYKKPSGETWA
ncbi:MAG: nitroreductase family protein [Deltaproteobacteria bacterium]|nr:MAG: nitroreductase family protein [Deltaproteobacteria bacterium]